MRIPKSLQAGLIAIAALSLLLGCSQVQRVESKIRQMTSPHCRIENIYPKHVLPGDVRRIIVEGQLLTEAPIIVSGGGLQQYLNVINDNYGYFDVYFSETGRGDISFILPGRKITRTVPWAVDSLTILDFNDGITGICNLVNSASFPPEVKEDVQRSLATAYLRLCERNVGQAYKEIESLFFRLRSRCNFAADVKGVVLDLLTFYREALLLDVVEF